MPCSCMYGIGAADESSRPQIKTRLEASEYGALSLGPFVIVCFLSLFLLSVLKCQGPIIFLPLPDVNSVFSLVNVYEEFGRIHFHYGV